MTRPCRRELLAGLAFGAIVTGIAPAVAAEWHNIDVTGWSPPLHFDMMDANTGKPVTAASFRGKIVLLYFGYTNCPDICPLTMQNVVETLVRLGKDGADFRLLFVTVDPDRDTVPVLKAYTAAFSPDVVGLRGNADQIARLARRFRIAWSVTPATATAPYEVSHSSAIYVFDGDGNGRLLLDSMATPSPDIAGTADDLRRVLHGPKPGWLARLSAMW